MRILVVGSGGVGSAFAPIAARRDFYEHVLFADYDEAKAQRVVELARANRCDAILNAADPRSVIPVDAAFASEPHTSR
jgi:saccharopine dehydrogenase (NAD+, L-lysine forming)